MKVNELKELLADIPDETEIDFLGYGSGAAFYERVTPQDFIYSYEQKTLIIKADWN